MSIQLDTQLETLREQQPSLHPLPWEMFAQELGRLTPRPDFILDTAAQLAERRLGQEMAAATGISPMHVIAGHNMWGRIMDVATPYDREVLRAARRVVEFSADPRAPEIGSLVMSEQFATTESGPLMPEKAFAVQTSDGVQYAIMYTRPVPPETL